MPVNSEDRAGQGIVDPSEKLEAIRQEMNDALEARSQGNEGMARVCARRAVGWAIRLRFDEALAAANTKNAFVLLEWLSRQDAVAEPYRQAAERLTTRINEDHELPHDQDPLVDADFLIRGLLGIGEANEADNS
ncbi:MAG: hypothetical protein ACLFWD_03810 [Anaerolineales bacterium]